MATTSSCGPRHPARRGLGILLAGVVLLAGCGGEADPATEGTDTTVGATTAADPDPTTAATDPTTAATGASSGTVEVAGTELGDVLVDDAGMTLYVFDEDDVDTSACTEGCLDTWPPLLASEVTTGEGVTADLGTFTRDDGDQQVTVNGLPLYYYAADSAPGDVNGQAVGDVWWVVDPAGERITASADSTSTPTSTPASTPASTTTGGGYGAAPVS